MQNFEARFRHHLSTGVRFDVALDIGAYRGDFSRLLRSFWPDIKIWQFEADERQRPFIPDAQFVLLGDAQREVDFYTVDESFAPTTGSSIYRENTEIYSHPLVRKMQMTTLDALTETIDFSGDWKEHGLVKIDTQGSELDILRGARRFLERYSPRALLLEVSLFPYNLGAPLLADVIAYLSGIQYRATDIFDVHYWLDGRLTQVDLYFERTAS
jgi:FkbM family methyltransferase